MAKLLASRTRVSVGTVGLLCLLLCVNRIFWLRSTGASIFPNSMFWSARETIVAATEDM